MKQSSRCGYIAIIGRPNVGKSTLLNCILGTKISITSPKPQTTRDQILGIKTINQDQAVFIDTPGLHEAGKRALNRYMNRLASSVIVDADVILFMVEANLWNEDDESVLEKLKQTESPVILVINKVDKLNDKALVLPFIDRLKNKFNFTGIVPLSAIKADNVVTLEKEIMRFLPEGPHLFPDRQITDKNIRFQVAEIVREKIIKLTEQEIPYSVSVEIEDYKQTEKLIEISVIIWVEREGQKPIVIGKNGELLKRIGTQARKDIEEILKQKVFLRLWVKVKDNWADDERAIKSLGYE